MAVEYPIPVVCCIIKKDNSILLGKRTNPEEYGLYGFPGGKIEYGEEWQHTVERELFEEVGIRNIDDIQLLNIFDDIIHKHFLAIFVMIHSYTGWIQNKEPNKCLGWEFHDIWNFPKEKTKALILFEEWLKINYLKLRFENK